MPIGKTISNIKLYVCNSYDQRVPIGVIGELYIGGIGLARGYLNNLSLTEKSFIKDTKNWINLDHCNHLYKTGDLVRYLNDGNLEYLGRKDYQIKLHGLRIELGEIEAKLNKIPFVEESLVLFDKSKDILIGYIRNSTIEQSETLDSSIIYDQNSRNIFKLNRHNIRNIKSAKKLFLNKASIPCVKEFFERKSYRQFTQTSVNKSELEHILNENLEKSSSNTCITNDATLDEILAVAYGLKDDENI